MAKEVSLGGIGKNPSIDQLTQVSPAKFISVATRQLETKAFRVSNNRANALPRIRFSAAISSAFRNENSTNNVLNLMLQRFERPESKRFLTSIEVQSLRNTIEHSKASSTEGIKGKK
jgi:hypothetical protein